MITGSGMASDQDHRKIGNPFRIHLMEFQNSLVGKSGMLYQTCFFGKIQFFEKSTDFLKMATNLIKAKEPADSSFLRKLLISIGPGRTVKGSFFAANTKPEAAAQAIGDETAGKTSVGKD